MVRKILGVIFGYFTMVFLIMGLFMIAYAVVGTEMAYRPDSYEVSMLWIVISAILGFIAAIAGGLVCSIVSQDRNTSYVLALLVLVLGLVMAVMVTMGQRPDEVRTGDVTQSEVMQKTQQPVWVAYMNPLIGVLGVYIGGGLRKKKEGVAL